MLMNLELAHKFLISDLTVRTLERDRANLIVLKTSTIFTTLFDSALIVARNNLQSVTEEMRKGNIRLVDTQKINQDFTAYTFAQDMLSKDVRYANAALRNKTLSNIQTIFKRLQEPF